LSRESATSRSVKQNQFISPGEEKEKIDMGWRGAIKKKGILEGQRSVVYKDSNNKSPEWVKNVGF